MTAADRDQAVRDCVTRITDLARMAHTGELVFASFVHGTQAAVEALVDEVDPEPEQDPTKPPNLPGHLDGCKTG